MRYQGRIAALLFLILALMASPKAWSFELPVKTDRQYPEIRTLLRSWAQQFPKNAELISIGTSDSGLPIEGLKIGNGATHHLVVGTHHGNEYGSTEVALGVAGSLAEQPIKNQTVFVIPVLNIGGYNGRDRYESNKTSSFDPNRNYPGPCGTEGPFTLKSTKALADFVARENIVASATLHTFYPAVVYPWGISTHDLDTPYTDLFKGLTQAATVESHYEIGNSTEVIYPADGTYEDYAFWKHGIWSLLFELGESHTPSVAALKKMVSVNTPGIRRMLEQAPLVRAEKHEFTGKCDTKLMNLDRHDE
jgi:carboxypeptidase T